MKFTKTTRTLTALAAIGALGLSACGGDSNGGSTDGDGAASSGETVTLNAATMVQPKTPNAPVENWFYDQLEERSDGRITIDRTEPESICPAQEIAQCIIDGRADVGTSIADYSPQLFPSLTIVSVPFMVDNLQVLMETLYKVNEENESAKAKWDEVGLKLVGAWGPGKLIIGTNEKVQNLDDINGMRFRVTGGFLQRAFESAGANVVALTAGETYEGIERGIADAVAWTMDGPVDYKMMEQLSIWSDPGVGHYTTFATWMNQDVYNGMPDDLKAVVDEVVADLNGGEGMKAFNEVTTPQCDAMLEHGNVDEFTAWEQAEADQWKEAAQAELIEQWVADAEANGLTDAQTYLDEYMAALEEAAGAEDLVEDPVAACIDRFASR